MRIPSLLQKAVILTAGTAVMAFGTGVIAINSFSGDILTVYAGLMVVFLGYKISTAVNYVENQHNFHIFLLNWKKGASIFYRENIYLAVGGAGISYGLALFVRAATLLDGSLGLIAGFFAVSGYMIAHMGLNNTLV
jgi:hypothetical protein